MSPENEAKIRSITEMGFSRQQAIEALEKFKYNENEAIDYILTQPQEAVAADGDDEMQRASKA